MPPCKSCKLEWDGSLVPTSFAMNGNNGKENKPSMEDATLAHECGTLTPTPSEGMEEEASVVELERGTWPLITRTSTMDDNNGEDNTVISTHEQGTLTLKEGQPNEVVLPPHLEV